MIDITISNVHDRGFAFAVTPTGEQVFIPPHTLAGNTLRAGDTIKAVLVVNPSDRSAHGTPWMAVRLETGEETIAHVTDSNLTDDIEARDRAVLETVNENVYVTTAEIATTVGIDPKSAGNSALRLFNAGKIAKADVYDKAVLETVNENVYVTTAEIAATVGIDPKSAGNSALRLFNAGKIAKADVYAKPGQARSSFTLWAADAKRFVEEA